MRPIERGPAPRQYSRYGNAIGDLEDQLGQYCSYCERRIVINLAVEHISPKSLDPERELDWDNFLLGCTNCNSVKGNKPTDGVKFVWPDKDNTLRAFEYKEGGLVEANPILSDNLIKKANKTITLVGLHRHPGQPRRLRPADRDKRWLHREEAWKLAIKNRDALNSYDIEPMRELVIDLAKNIGFFSVWMKVFESDSDMRRRLIDAFIGTSPDCFDKNGNITPRPGGQL